MSGDAPDAGASIALEVAVKLENIRGIMETGFAKLDGRLDVYATRTNQVEAEVAALRAEMEALKRGRWPLPTLGVLGGLVGTVAALISLYR